MSNNRLQYFDILKGWAIFFVVMGHVLTMCIRDIDSCFAFKLISEIHMPIFFFISGYFSYKATEGKIKLPNIRKRFIQLIIPAVIVGSLWIWYFPHSGLKSPIVSTFDAFYFNSWKNGYWFTFCLFEIIILFALVGIFTNLIKSKYSFITTSLIFEIVLIALTKHILSENIVSLLSLDLTTLFFPIFIIGVAAKKYTHAFNYVINSNYIYTLSLILFGILLYFVAYFWEFTFIPESNLFKLRILLHIPLIIIAINIVKLYENKHSVSTSITPSHKLYRTWSYLGRESLSIYLLHYFFLFPISPLKPIMGTMGLGITPALFISAIIASVIIVITLGVNVIISKSNILALLILGKQNK